MSKQLMFQKRKLLVDQKQIDQEHIRRYHLPRFIYQDSVLVKDEWYDLFYCPRTQKKLYVKDPSCMDGLLEQGETYLIDDLTDDFVKNFKLCGRIVKAQVWSASKCVTPFSSRMPIS